MTTRTVLIVDDEAPIRRLLSRWLEKWGYHTKEAANATEALEVMLAEPASIIVIDITMPGHDGLWLAERIREKWPKTPIIMATAIDEMDTVTRSRRAGAVDYVLKPFERELVRQALGRAEVALEERPKESEKTSNSMCPNCSSAKVIQVPSVTTELTLFCADCGHIWTPQQGKQG